MENERVLAAKTIRVESLLEQLQFLYDMGVDYIDLYGIQKEPVHEIMLSFSRDYMGKEFQHNFDELLPEGDEDNPPGIKKTLTDDDITNLI